MNESELTGHALWDELASLDGVLTKIDALRDPEASSRIDEVREFVGYTKAVPSWVDYKFLGTEMIDGVSAAWAGVLSNLSTFLQDPVGYVGYLGTGIGELAAVRATLASLPKALGNAAVRGAVTKSIDAYREQLDASRSAVMHSWQESMDAAAKREELLEHRIADLGALLSTNETTLADLENRITDDESRLRDALTKNNEAFNLSQTAKEKAFNDWLHNQEAEFQELAEPHILTIKRATHEAETNLNVVKELRKSTVEASHLAVGEILSEEYRKYSESERKVSWVAYGVGVAAILVGIFIVSFAFGLLNEELRWQNVTLKLSLTAALGGVATVAFRYGGKATQRATSFMRQALELKSLRPYLQDVEGSDVAKTEFFKRAFGNAWVEGGIPNRELDLNEVLVKLLTVAMQRVDKTSQPPT